MLLDGLLLALQGKFTFVPYFVVPQGLSLETKLERDLSVKIKLEDLRLKVSLEKV